MLNWVYKILIVLFGVLSFLPLAGLLTFGHGLGDLVYTGLALLSTLILLLVAFLNRKHFSADKQLATIIIFVVILALLLYKASIGRGPENPWDGNIISSK